MQIKDMALVNCVSPAPHSTCHPLSKNKERIMEKRIQPEWKMPEPINPILLPPLKLHNSLSSKKAFFYREEQFVPLNGKHVEWYSCGPTVYDVSHMGHARTYISFDIIRRVLVDYFRFDVNYVMNITDIDDKIIKRARQDYLFNKFKQEKHSIAEIVSIVRFGISVSSNTTRCHLTLKITVASFFFTTATIFHLPFSESYIYAYQKMSKTNPDPDLRNFYSQKVQGLNDLLFLNHDDHKAYDILLDGAKDAITNYLDTESGALINDLHIFENLSKKYEDEFHKDMAALNIPMPDTITRVSEYIVQIVNFIQKIIAKGFAYVVASCFLHFIL
ncbi:unnamed protein product [Protopolystoma xenopodis]|uniref:tRNA synthetases class I catalytic domain-containing protein n=1 Tax=Protopolystoma xenopodis TaxID=117903 RepID=A0A3S5CF20_9PLAT|nr:unnamed protein product [Protopolystoma xenopodis]